MSEDNVQEPSFDEAVEQLEKLVEEMESGELVLDDLIRKFEDGAKLVHVCQRHLKDAELKIEKLKEDIKDFEVEPLEVDPENPE